ncbi:hypothetical protein [Pseudonocardia hierapolitana]|uniref:hypothetical protein n=1 Tax=Pseudonocardia hierapolitana TaxID=1128676 RepID=UPI0011BF5900|nr:hypothetical protein [Pseudonocardia hierapolitana]
MAELLARCAGANPPPPRPTGPDGAVSVAALLRREGRGPHVADRPLVPRGHARIAQPPPEPPRRSVRKVAVAAGALFAATAVLGPSVVEDAADRSAAGRGAGIPLPPASLPLSADYGWSGNAIGTGATAADDDVVLAAMRQIFAEDVPSEVGSPAFDRLGTEPAAGNQYFAVRRLQTPDRASAGPTGPAVTPESGTVPPGGAGTPPGGTWSYATQPNSSKPGGGPPGDVPARARSNGAGNGPPADTSGNGPPQKTPASARSAGGPGNGPPSDTPGKRADRPDRPVKAASGSEGSPGPGRKNTDGAAAENASGGKNARSRAATDDKAGDNGEKDRPNRERSDDGGSGGKDQGSEKENDSSDRGDNGGGSDSKGGDSKDSGSKDSGSKDSGSKDSSDKGGNDKGGNDKGSSGKGGSEKGSGRGNKGNGGDG